MEYFVYILIDPRVDVPFYVGKGKNARFNDHFCEARRGKCKNKHLERKILQIWREGFEITVKIAETFDDEDLAFLLERNLITALGRRDLGTGPLTNLTAGGEGVTSKSPDTIRRNVESTRKAVAAWSQEKREEVSANRRKAGRQFWADLTESERKGRTKHLRSRFGSMTEDEKAVWTQECRIRHQRYNTREWRDKISRTCKALWDEPESRIAHGNMISQRKSMMSKEQQLKHRQNTSAAVKRYWASMTPEERAERTKKLRAGITAESRDKISAARKQSFKDETLEQKSDRIKRHKEGSKKVDWQKVTKKVASKKQNWTEAQRAKYSRQMSDAAHRRWQKEKQLAPQHLG